MFKWFKQGWDWAKSKVQSGSQWLRDRWAESRQAVRLAVSRPHTAMGRVAVVVTLWAVFAGRVLAQTSGSTGAPDPSSVVSTANTAFNTVAAAALIFLGFGVVYKLVKRYLK